MVSVDIALKLNLFSAAAARKFLALPVRMFQCQMFFLLGVIGLALLKMKKRRLLIVVVMVLTVGAISVLFVSRYSRHQTLSAYVEELRARGEKITFAELIASLSSNTNDSLAVLTNVVLQLGPLPGDATNIDIMHYVGPGRAQVAWRVGEPTWAVSPVRSPHITWTDVGNRVTQMAAPLDKLRQAMKAPVPNAGFRTNYFERATPFRAVQSAANWLASEALWDLHEGRRADALVSIQAIAGLANLHREEYSLVSQMTRAAVAGLGLSLTWEALQTKKWSDEQLLALQKCWEGFDFLETAEKGMEGERCMGRESIKKYREENSLTEKRLSKLYFESIFLDSDLLFQLRHIQDYVEQTRALRAGRPWSEVSDLLDKFDARIDALTNSLQRFRYLLTILASPHFKRAVSVSVHRETERRLTVTAIALNRCEHKYGQFPPSLDRLVPEFLTAVPQDCMNGESLRYQRKGNDPFILYSVGEDGRDDSGDSNPAKANGKSGLWEGRDAVWPLADPQ